MAQLFQRFTRFTRFVIFLTPAKDELIGYAFEHHYSNISKFISVNIFFGGDNAFGEITFHLGQRLYMTFERKLNI